MDDKTKSENHPHNRFDLHEERLTTTDEKGHRVYLYPEDVKGIWHNRRIIVNWILIFIFLVLPWLKWNGHQLILLNLPAREFHFFGTTFYAHDAPIFGLVIAGFVLLMGFITSIWGRVWCGWTCPQTVFIETLYRKVEILIEGKARQRKQLEQQAWNAEKIFKRLLKWSAFLLISLHIAHSFLGYFVGAQELFWITLTPPSEHPTLFTSMLVITAIFLIDFGWFREQFCIIACPYGRIQSVMMDENSLVIAYDAKRGEPRRGPETPRDTEGDCINCYHCVKVCPTGIDIRRGTQLECIACTNCIDACDEIMDKLKKPTGLIRYDSENGLKGKEVKKVRPRSIVYLVLMGAVLTALSFAIKNSSQMKMTFVRGAKTPYREVKTGDKREVLNNYRVRFDYKGAKVLNVGLAAADPEVAKQVRIITPVKKFKIVGGESKQLVVHFRFVPQFLKQGSRMVRVNLIDMDKTEKNILMTKEVKLVGPLK
jgi:cytochrome c oxidase accessory protein FixG